MARAGAPGGGTVRLRESLGSLREPLRCAVLPQPQVTSHGWSRPHGLDAVQSLIDDQMNVMTSVGSWVLSNSSSPVMDEAFLFLLKSEVMSFFETQFASEISEDTESGPRGPHSSEPGDVGAGARSGNPCQRTPPGERWGGSLTAPSWAGSQSPPGSNAHHPK